jgi:hypothetical protein
MLDWLVDIQIIIVLAACMAWRSICGAMYLIPLTLGYITYYDEWGFSLHFPMGFIIVCSMMLIFTRPERESEWFLWICYASLINEAVGWRLYEASNETYLYQPVYMVLLVLALLTIIGGRHGKLIRSTSWRGWFLRANHPRYAARYKKEMGC